MKHRVAAIQMTSGQDVEANLLAAAKLINAAAAQGAKLIVLPEMFAVMGLDQMAKVKTREPFGKGPIQDFLQQQAQQHRIWLVGGTIPIAAAETTEKVNAACLVYDDHGKLVGRYDKIHMFDVLIGEQEIHSESKTTLCGKKITVLDSPFGKLGLAVCYDLRFPELFRTMHDQQVEIILLPAAFTYTTGVAHWEILVRARAIENQVFLIAAGQTGTHENGRKTFGNSMIVDPWGTPLALAQAGPGVVIADIDLEYMQNLRRNFPR